MNEFTLLYQTTSAHHAYTDEVICAVQEFKQYGELIPDSVAREIAAWWHSPRYGNSTRLSTMGAVGIETQISDFCSREMYEELEDFQRDELDALEAYILVIQANKRREIDSLKIQEGDILEDCPEDGKILACHEISVSYGRENTPGKGMKVYFESGETDIVAAPQRVNVYRV